MSETEVTETEEQVAAPETDETKPPPKDLPPDEKWERIDFKTADPEDVEKRFNRLYGEMKRTKMTMKTLAADNAKILDKLTEFTGRLDSDRAANTVQDLKAQQRAAAEEGDFEKMEQISEKLYEIGQEAVQEKKAESEKQEAAFELDDDEQQRLISWAQETDADGNPIRPWADPSHPKWDKTLKLAEAVLNDPDIDMESALAEMDRIMNPSKPERKTAAVLDNNANARPKEKSKVKLDENMKAVARAMYPSMPAKEAEARYAKAMEALA